MAHLPKKRSNKDWRNTRRLFTKLHELTQELRIHQEMVKILVEKIALGWIEVDVSDI